MNNNEVVVITGAGSGMGRETAILFAKDNYIVVCTDINKKMLDETLLLIKKEGKEAYSIISDLINVNDIEKLAKEVEKKFEKVDILINCAGALGKVNNLIKATEEAMDFIIDINLKGVYRCCKYFLPLMIKQKRGLIINIASRAGKTPMPTAPIYTAAKWGVLGFTKSLNLALREYGIKVSSVNPASTNTNFWGKVNEDSKEYYNKLLDPIDIARACLFLAKQSKKCIVSEIDLIPMSEVDEIVIK